MINFDFDSIKDRQGTHSLKYDALKDRFGREDLIPLWVADMDFLSPPTITKAIAERTQHGIFGYGYAYQGYYDSIINWLKDEHNWSIEKQWLSFIPGIVKGLAFSIDCFTDKGDKIFIQPPVYPPFHAVPKHHQREVVYNPLVLESGQYKMDLNGLKDLITSDCKMLILCNPHNPGGRVWTKRELIDIADICYNNNILVVSDEIHSDLAFDRNKHIPFASVSEKAAMNSITFMAPSKTFNIAGIVSSFAVVPNKEIRDKFYSYLNNSELADGHILAYLAAEVAYNTGKEWLMQAKKYIKDNITFVDDYLKKNIPQIKAMIPEASFLIWLDCKELNLSQDDLVSLFVNDAKLALNNGTTFGIEGTGYMRLNVGTSRQILAQALDNLNKAVNNK